MSINRLIVEGYKSFKERKEIELSNLTILAGANSSGKSSIMQPILLLKQTFEASYDPGPLLISGPNVVFSETDQMLWAAPAEPRTEGFSWGLEVAGRDHKLSVETQLRRRRDGSTPLVIDGCIWSIGDEQYVLNESLGSGEIEAMLDVSVETKEKLSALFQNGEQNGGAQKTNPVKFVVRRNRAVLSVFLETPPLALSFFPELADPGAVDRVVRQIIHVPGLRGNPRRTYPVTAVTNEFPGLFHDYVASIVARWQRNDKTKLRQVGRDLQELGLSWKVRAEQKSDTEVELLVGRLPSSRRGGSRDLVSIADVGFGFSQSLPVVIALLAADPGQMVYLEQPEIHLHPRAQFALADLIVRAANRGVQVVVETHSELLLLGIQKSVAQGALRPNQTCLHWFSRDQTGLTSIVSADLDEQGAFGQVPVDFGDVKMMAIRQYLASASQGRY